MPVKKIQSQKSKVKSLPKKTVKRTAKVQSRRVSVASQSVARPAPKLENAPRASLSASVYDLKGKAVGKVSLPAEIFGAEEKPELISQAVRVYLANQRQGTVSTKTRGEVQGSTRKIYRQKGTGRARHGAVRAPIFVHGGIALGPKPRDFSLSLPQKMKRKALFSALSGKLRDGEIKVVDLEKMTPKTKVMFKLLNSLDLKGRTLFVVPSGMKEFKNVFLASRNIPTVKILTAQTLNTYDVLDNKGILLMKDSVEVLKKHFLS